MAIDTKTPDSEGWWLELCYKAMFAKPAKMPVNGAPWETRAQRLDRLWSYYEGNPPLPEGAASAKKAIRDFQRKARANYAAMSVECRLDRQKLLGVRTVRDSDVDGDDMAREIALANGFAVVAQNILMYRDALGEAYALAGQVPEGEKFPVLTAEDPRLCVTIQDPIRENKTLAGLKLYRDDEKGEDVAHLYLPGEVKVATRKGASRAGGLVRFSAQSWNWDDSRSGPIPELTDDLGRKHVAMVKFSARQGKSVFEAHTDVLDRINHMILQRVVVAVMQAFRQRAIKGDLPEKDEDGNVINYDELFPADPGALWQLPPDVEMWESAGVDLTPILSSVKDDAQEFCACTRTPLYYVFPDAANGSAEGAALMREGLTYSCEDGIERATPPFLDLWRLAFMLAGEGARANGELSLIWAPVERFSMSERGDAAVKAKASGVPQRSILSDVWQFRPEVVKRMEEERLTDVLLAPDVPVPGPDATTLATQQLGRPKTPPPAKQQAPAAQQQPVPPPPHA